MTDMTMEIEKKEVEETEGVERTRDREIFIPRVDIYETAETVVLIADMPGVSDEGVDITLEKNLLTIRGKVEFTEPEGYEATYTEYRVGDFERTFKLSDEVDRENIEATLKNGVLRLEMTKAAAAQSRKILVRTEG